jgi:hypothetical protein
METAQHVSMSITEFVGIIMTIVGAMGGIILGLVKWLGNKMNKSIDKLIDVTNGHTTVIAVEQSRNDNQDERLDKHEDDISAIKERVWEVTYKTNKR